MCCGWERESPKGLPLHRYLGNTKWPLERVVTQSQQDVVQVCFVVRYSVLLFWVPCFMDTGIYLVTNLDLEGMSNLPGKVNCISVRKMWK